MRRLWAAGTAIVMCLALGGVPAVAQEAPASPAASPAAAPGNAVVTGKEFCGTNGCDEMLSDPRVSGPGTVEFEEYCPAITGQYGNVGCTYWGTFTIDGPDGNWSGPWAGLWDDSLQKGSLLITLEGSGAYEGWAFVAHWLDTMQGMADVYGVIYKGSPPLMSWPSATPAASPSPGM